MNSRSAISHVNCKAAQTKIRFDSNFKYHVKLNKVSVHYNQFIFPGSSWKIEGAEIKCDLSTSEEKHKKHPQKPNFIV